MNSNQNEKIYYSIKEVCTLLDIKPYTLRNWENFIPLLSPKKNRFGHRIYSKQDIEKIEMVKYLLYEKKYTFKGILDLFIKYNGDITKFYDYNSINNDNSDKEKFQFKFDYNSKSLWKSIKETIIDLKNFLDKKN